MEDPEPKIRSVISAKDLSPPLHAMLKHFYLNVWASPRKEQVGASHWQRDENVLQLRDVLPTLLDQTLSLLPDLLVDWKANPKHLWKQKSSSWVKILVLNQNAIFVLCWQGFRWEAFHSRGFLRDSQKGTWVKHTHTHTLLGGRWLGGHLHNLVSSPPTCNMYYG